MQGATRRHLLAQLHSFYAKRIEHMEEHFYVSKSLPLQISNLKGMRKQSHQSQNGQLLKDYQGQPTLAGYLSSGKNGFTLQEDSSQGLKNRNMRRLSLRNIPRLVYLYRRFFNSYQYEEVEVLNDSKNNSQEWKIQFLHNPNPQQAIPKIVNQHSNEFLLVAQTIVFTKLSFDKFKEIFGRMNTVVKIMRKLKGSMENIDVGDIKDRSEYLLQVLFRLFCLPQIEYILWPSIVLQPLLGSRESIGSLLNNFNNNNNEDRRINEEGIFEDTIKQYLQNVMLTNSTPEAFKPTEKQAVLLEGISSTINRYTCNHQKFIVALLGTNTTIVERQLFVEWNQFNIDQLRLMITKTPFELILEDINGIIDKLNQYKQKEYCEASKKCLFKLCKIMTENERQVCIPLRYSHYKEKYVLVKPLEQIQSQFSPQFKWVKLSELTVNKALPTHSQEQRKLYNSFSSNFSIFEILQFIYSDFMGDKPMTYIKVLRMTYPQNEVMKKILEQSRCTKCYYLVRKGQQFLCCRYCLKKYHFCCVTKRNIEDKKYVKHIYETENQEDVWACQACSTCKTCYQSIIDLNTSLKCLNCHDSYHFQCGKLMDQRGQFASRQKFVCQNCLKCGLCKASLKDEQYFIQEEKIYCQICLSDVNWSFCQKCEIKIRIQESIQCSRPHCKVWIHTKCDLPELSYHHQSFTTQNFMCSQCRMGQKRKLLKWILQEFRMFDDCEFFNDPDYQSIPEYKQVIKNPICFALMNSRIHEGYYDINTYQRILNDIKLIANNAMLFNMPREQVHFRGKILLVLGERFLNRMKEILDFSQLQYMTKPIESLFLSIKSIFYKDIQKNLPSILLNYGKKQNARIEIIRFKQNEEQDDIFSFRHILSKGLKNSQLRYCTSGILATIQQLFKAPKIIPATWSKISQNLCYYHPRQKQPIIYQCKVCWQTYCCTKICYRHTFCFVCRKYGCSCNNSSCVCPPLKEKQQRQLQKQIKPILQANSISKLEYTEYHKYCLKCARQLQRDCYICGKLCYFGYENCNECSLVYHLSCESSVKGFKDIKNQNNDLSPIRIDKICSTCTRHPRNSYIFKQIMTDHFKREMDKFNKIRENLEFFKQIYEQNGIRMTSQQICNILSLNYDQYDQKWWIFQRMQSLKQNSFNLDEQSSYCQQQNQFIFDIQNPRVESEYQHNTYKEFFKIKEVQKKDFQLDYTFSPIEIFKRFRFNTEIEAIHSLNYLIIQDHFKQAKKSQIFYTLPSNQEKLHPFKINTTSFFQDFHQAVLAKANKGNFLVQSQMEKQIFIRQAKEYRSYLCFKFLNQHHRFGQILFDKVHYPLYEPFSFSVPKPPPSRFYQTIQPESKNLMYLCLKRYLTTFALRIFNQQKIALRKGNTYVLGSGQNDWRVLKKILDSKYYIHLKKNSSEGWTLIINDNIHTVHNLNELMTALRSIGAQVYTYEQTVAFMGFSLVDSIYRSPRHFTQMFQNKEFYDLTARGRKKIIQKVYDRYEWLMNGIIEDRQTKKSYKVKQNKPFYLSKRIKKQAGTEDQNKSQSKQQTFKPFITFEDLKKQIFLKQNNPLLLQQPKISHQPINKVFIAPSKIDRLGLFMAENVKKYTTVIQYTGEVVSQSIADLRQKKYKDDCYMFTVGQDQHKNTQIIDATHIGNKARYLNHSCDPNCRAKVVNVQGKNKILIYTVKDVKKNEELTYDYQFKIESGNRIQCKCGSKICQGRLN